jgi:hypothetical protein
VLGVVTEAAALRIRARHGEHDVVASATATLRSAWRGALPLTTEVGA